MITNELPISSYLLQAGSFVYDVTFEHTSKSDLQVIVYQAGSKTVLEDADYSLSNSTITYVSTGDVVATDFIVILRATTKEQQTSFNQGVALDVKDIELALDHAMKLIQELDLQKSITFPVNESTQELPQDRANKILAFDADGNIDLSMNIFTLAQQKADAEQAVADAQAAQGKAEDAQEAVESIESGLPAKVNKVDVTSDLTVNDPTKVASAKSAYDLKQLIDVITALLTSDDVSLDELQEIVNYIKLNRADLENLSIASIAGLQTALDSKALSFHEHAESDIRVATTFGGGTLDNVLSLIEATLGSLTEGDIDGLIDHLDTIESDIITKVDKAKSCFVGLDLSVSHTINYNDGSVQYNTVVADTVISFSNFTASKSCAMLLYLNLNSAVSVSFSGIEIKGNPILPDNAVSRCLVEQIPTFSGTKLILTNLGLA